MKKKKLFYKIITFTFLFIFSLSFCFLPNVNIISVAKAEEVTTTEIADSSRYLDSNLLHYVDEAISNGARTFDYYQLYKDDSKMIYDEYVILYDFELKPLNDDGDIIVNLSPRKFFDPSYSQNGMFRLITPPQTYNYTSYINLSYNQGGSIGNGFYPTSFSYHSHPKFTNVYNASDFEGAFFYFSNVGIPSYSSNFPTDQLFQNSTNDYPMYYDVATSSYARLLDYFRYSSIEELKWEDISPYISAKFVSLSDVITYAYTKGVEVTSLYQEYGVFANAKITGKLTYNGDGDSTYTLNINEDLTYRNGFVNLSKLSKYEEIYVKDNIVYLTGNVPEEPYDYYYWDGAELYLEFGRPLYYNNNYIYIQGDDVNLFDTFRVKASYSYSENQPNSVYFDTYLNWNDFRLESPQVPVFVYGIYFGVDGRAGDIFPSWIFKDFSVNDVNSFNQGYENGYRDGKKDGIDIGYKNGLDVGEKKGYNAGLNANNSFYSLISAVFDVPISYITSFLDIEILGVNLSQFFYSLLAICIVFAVIRFVIRLF